jgi:hypothetical protein
MDKFTRFTLIFLSAQLFVMGLLVSHLAYKLGYEQGRASVYLKEDGPEGTCLVPSGCPDMQKEFGYRVDANGNHRYDFGTDTLPKKRGQNAKR